LNDVKRLTKRADFLAAAGGAKVHGTGFVLQLRDRADDHPARAGFTVSKKVGNAVERNRVRRRLREIVRLNGPGIVRAGCDYVVIGRKNALTLSYDRLSADLTKALGRQPQTPRTRAP
jgi:ribonuclease P protein component